MKLIMNFFEVIEVLDEIALFSPDRISDDELPDDLYKYDLRTFLDGDGYATIESWVVVNYAGSIITKHPIDLGEQGWIYIGDIGINFLGDWKTIQDFMSK